MNVAFEEIGDECIQLLARGLPRLQYLEAQWANITDKGAEYLTVWKELRHLSVGIPTCYIGYNTAISLKGLKRICTNLHLLQVLCLEGKAISQ
mgnify:CR=1 FL=1